MDFFAAPQWAGVHLLYFHFIHFSFFLQSGGTETLVLAFPVPFQFPVDFILASSLAALELRF